MRIEYDRIQQRMKDQLKRPTPFDRIKKFFGKNKSKRKNLLFCNALIIHYSFIILYSLKYLLLYIKLLLNILFKVIKFNVYIYRF
jgi:hypothetical protein